MALLYILTGHKETDDVMRNLDLNYMKKEYYGEHIEQVQKQKPEHVALASDDRVINVLAHGDATSIAGESGDAFAVRLIGTFGKDQLSTRTILIYSCNVAQGGAGSVLQAIVATLQQKSVRNTPIVGSVDETFTMSTGNMMVLKPGANVEQLSKLVEDLRGNKRDQAAGPYLLAFRSGWLGAKIRGDGNIAQLDAAAAGAYIQQF